MDKKRILILYYSHSSQTRNLLQGVAKGLLENDIEVVWNQLRPVKNIVFPFGSFVSTFHMMVRSFFRGRFEIEPLKPQCYSHWDLVIIAGPTWSYNPSGPVLSLLDSEGKIFSNRLVLPLISCRRYWRLHHLGISKILKRLNAQLLKPIVFVHPVKEPWSTIGVVLKLAGMTPESGRSWMRKFYPKYGHSRAQIIHAEVLGKELGEYLNAGKELQGVQFGQSISMGEEK